MYHVHGPAGRTYSVWSSRSFLYKTVPSRLQQEPQSRTRLPALDHDICIHWGNNRGFGGRLLAAKSLFPVQRPSHLLALQDWVNQCRLQAGSCWGVWDLQGVRHQLRGMGALLDEKQWVVPVFPCWSCDNMEIYWREREEGYYGKNWQPELREMWDTKLTMNRLSWRGFFSFLELFIDESL